MACPQDIADRDGSEASAPVLARPVYLIGSDASLKQRIRSGLEAGAYDIRDSGHIAETSEALAEADPALIVLDNRLSEQDGLEDIERLLGICPVVMLTQQATVAAVPGYSWPGHLQDVLELIEQAVLSADESGAAAEKMASPLRRLSFSLENLPTMDELQSRYVEFLLSDGSYSRARIAEALGISERTVYRILGTRQAKSSASAPL